MGEMAEDAYVEALLEEAEEEMRLLGYESFDMQMARLRAMELENEKMLKGGSKVKDYPNSRNFTPKYNQQTLYTEDVLNRTTWVTGQGEILEVAHMGKNHIRNTLNFLYKRKDKYWLNCRDGKLIEQFENGEDFFQRVIRRSTLWTELIRVLTDDGATGFNFEIEGCK